MAVPGPPPPRRRPRRGSLERPVSGRVYRGTWLLIALPLLVAAFSVARPTALARPALPAAFDGAAAAALAQDLARRYPDRSPGSPGAAGAARWLERQLTAYGLPVQVEPFEATIPGLGRRRLQNLVTTVNGPPQSSDTIVVMAHRDDGGTGPGANDNASGTAALIELARAYAAPAGTAAAVAPAHRIVFLSSDGGSFGSLGAARFIAKSPYRRDVVAVVNLDAIAGTGSPRIELAGAAPRSPAATLLRTAAARLTEQTGAAPRRPSAFGQLVDLAFPFSLYGQAPFVAHGVPAVTLTTAGSRPPSGFTDTRVSASRLGAIGRAAQDLVGSLDQGLELAQGTASYVWVGDRLIRGWAIELVLIASLLPFLVAAVDLFARCRRRRIALGPALRSYRSRLGFWLLAGALFLLFGLAGAFPRGASRPIAPGSAAATHWPVVPLAGLAVLVAAAWLVTRVRLLPRRAVSAEEELAGHTIALLALAVVALTVVAINPFALVFVVPSLHAWLWLPQSRGRPAVQAGLLVLGLAGPFLLLWSIGARFGLGLDAPWYLAALLSVGYVQLPPFAVLLAWAAAGGQLAALAAGRYAPYPDAEERGPRGPVRELVRTVVLVLRRQRRVSRERRSATAG
ncbi:MAG TPA: M28 family peptidase [Gaiellaceae bacterium]|jgi:hypothetical protein|nr:M28 family peptidase [Gaiellaceae bacterium]